MTTKTTGCDTSVYYADEKRRAALRLCSPEDRAEIERKLWLLGFKDIVWESETQIRACHPKRDTPMITAPIKRLGFHVGAGGSSGGGRAYASVFSRLAQKQHEESWARMREGY